MTEGGIHMPDKAQIYAQMADDTARKITGDS